MRRILSLLLALLMLAGAAFAAETSDAYGIALEMAQQIPQMQDIKAAPLGNTPDRAIWFDSRTDQKCALTVYEDTEAAETAAVVLGTRYTSARTVGSCLLQIDSDLAIEIIDAYQHGLAQVLGVALNKKAPDYILNVNTRKFHIVYCPSVEAMKASNQQAYSGSRDRLIEHGYEACKNCKP